MRIKLITLCWIAVNTTCNALAQTSNTIDYKNKWAVGADIGTIAVDGDVRSDPFRMTEGIHFYKPFAKWFGVKLKFMHGAPTGMNGLENENFAKNTSWAPYYSAPVRQPNGTVAFGYTSNGVFTPAAKADIVYYNYKTSVNELSASGVFTLPIPYSKPVIGLYVGLGAGALFYKVKVNALNGTATYESLFKEINQTAAASNMSPGETARALRKRMDKTYETDGEKPSGSIFFTKNISSGIDFFVTQKITYGLGWSLSLTKTDLLDGQRWQEHAYGDAVATRDFDHINYFALYAHYFFR